MSSMKKLLSSLLFILIANISCSALANEEYWEYTFRPGDSLWKIANQYTTSPNNWKQIKELNLMNQGVNRRIQIGSRIKIPISMLKVQPTPAKIVAISGAVTLLRANGNKSELQLDTLLYSGDRVITQDHQIVRIEFADQSQLQVLPNSEIILDKLSHHKKTGMVDTQIRLNSGRINTQVIKQNKGSRYEIITPSAITAVRGTAFRMSSDDSLVSRTEVTEGLVKVYNEDSEQSVKEGFGLIAKKGEPLSKPIKLLEPPTLNITQPINKQIAQLSWNKLTGAIQYRYQIATDDTFKELIVNQQTQDHNVNINDLTPNHYYIRVRGIDQYQLEGINSTIDLQILEIKQTDHLLKDAILPTGINLLNL